MSRDWVEWHRSYDRPGSSLTARLSIVTEMLADAFDRAPAGEIRCLSLCAGEARDLDHALSGHPRAVDVVGAGGACSRSPTTSGECRGRM